MTSAARHRAHAVAAHYGHRYDLIVVSGHGTPHTEAEQLATYLNHPTLPVLWECHARSIAGNAVNTAHLLHPMYQFTVIDSIASISNRVRQHHLFRTTHPTYRTTITQYGRGHHRDWRAGIIGLSHMSTHLTAAAAHLAELTTPRKAHHVH